MAVVVVNTGGALSEPEPAMAAVVRNMAGAGGVAGADQGLRSDTKLLRGRGDRWRLTRLLAC